MLQDRVEQIAAIAQELNALDYWDSAQVNTRWESNPLTPRELSVLFLGYNILVGPGIILG